MADIKDGGSAFPREDYQLDGRKLGQSGMSLRDYFAGQALAGALANQMLLMTIDANSSESTRVAVAVYAYATADAMLKAREVCDVE